MRSVRRTARGQSEATGAGLVLAVSLVIAVIVGAVWGLVEVIQALTGG